MSSRKCYVCSCKSSSRWFKVSEELHEDVCACFNVKETVVLSDGSLCSSCRRNLSRWREKRPTNGKYFKTPNSRGKPGLNKAPIARKNRKLALLTRNLSEISPLFQLPEDVFLEVAAFLDVSDILRLRQTCSHANQICMSNFLWKVLVKRDFPYKNHLDESVLSNSSLAYKLFYLSNLSTELNRTQLWDFVDKLNAKEKKLLEENAELKHRLNNLHVRLQSLQNDPDPTTPVTKLQEQVHYITYFQSYFLANEVERYLLSLYWVKKINKTLLNWGKYETPAYFSN